MTNTWTKLSATANKGATSIQVLDARGWKVGDERGEVGLLTRNIRIQASEDAAQSFFMTAPRTS